MKRVNYQNLPSTGREYMAVVKDLNEILALDQCFYFRFDVMFTGDVNGINNFQCKVYHMKCLDENPVLAILSRGETYKMKQLIDQENDEPGYSDAY